MTQYRALLLFVVTLAFGAAPFLSEPFRGYPAGSFPVDILRPSIQPAGYAFSIWGLIYLWLAVFAVVFLWKRREDPDWLLVSGPMILSLAVGSLWLYIAPTMPLVAGLSILVMAGAALTAFLRADTFADRWTLAAPIAIYAGWLSAASAVSTGVILAGYGVLSDTGAALAMLAVVIVLAGAMQYRQPRLPEYGLTVIWALLAVVAVNWGQNVTVFLAAAIAVLIVAGGLVLLLPRLRRGV